LSKSDAQAALDTSAIDQRVLTTEWFIFLCASYLKHPFILKLRAVLYLNPQSFGKEERFLFSLYVYTLNTGFSGYNQIWNYPLM